MLLPRYRIFVGLPKHAKFQVNPFLATNIQWNNKKVGKNITSGFYIHKKTNDYLLFSRQIKRVLKRLNDIKYIFVATDSNPMISELSNALHRFDVSIVRLQPPKPHIDLAILGQANYFIGNCVSSFTAFVKRERDVRGLGSEFWCYPQRKKQKHEEL